MALFTPLVFSTSGEMSGTVQPMYPLSLKKKLDYSIVMLSP